MVRFGLVALALLWVSWTWWSGRPISRPPGVLAPREPLQQALRDGPRWQIDGYDVRALARFEVQARVLSAERYRFDREADLAPIDLTLGWGPMSANEVLDTLEIAQGSRFYSWSSREPRIPPGAIARHSANMHMMPLDGEVRRGLLRARRGSLVHVSGWLVEARGTDGWKWRSSLTRADTGNGACELVLVERVLLE